MYFKQPSAVYGHFLLSDFVFHFYLMANQTQYPATSHANSMTTNTDLCSRQLFMAIFYWQILYFIFI